MKGFVSNRWLDALIKLIIFLAVVHVILLVAGWLLGTNIGLFGIRMFWPHWSFGIGHNTISVVLLAVIYFAIYAWFTPQESIESR